MTPLPLDHVGLGVPNVGEASAWYEGMLGLSVAWTDVGRALLRTASGVFLELHHYPRSGGVHGTRRFHDYGYNHLAFMTPDVPETYAQLQARGMTFFGEPQVTETEFVTGHTRAIGTDPWGNTIELRSAPVEAPAGLWLDHVGVVVPNVRDAVRWYAQAVGWHVRASHPQHFSDHVLGLGCPPQPRGAIVSAGQGCVELQQFGYPTRDAELQRMGATGQWHLAVRCEDVYAERARLERAGIDVSDGSIMVRQGEWEGFESMRVVDPFGNVVEWTSHPATSTPPV